MPTIILLRHAQASFGGADYDVLSELGHRQVERVAEALTARGLQPDRVVSGGLRRQLDTIAPWGGPDDGLHVDPRFDEYDAADLLGAHSESAARLEGGEPVSSREFQRVLDEAMDAWIAAGTASAAEEPWPVFRDRVADAVRELAGDLGSGETALVCTSGGPIAAACLAALGLDDHAFPAFNRVVVNTGLTKLIVGRRGTTLVSFNEHGHLEADGLVTYR